MRTLVVKVGKDSRSIPFILTFSINGLSLFTKKCTLGEVLEA